METETLFVFGTARSYGNFLIRRNCYVSKIDKDRASLKSGLEWKHFLSKFLPRRWRSAR